MDFAAIDFTQIGAGLIGIGVIAKGIADYLAKTKSPERGCLYGDEAHGTLEKKLDLIIELLGTHAKQSTETHDWVLIVKTILEAKK